MSLRGCARCGAGEAAGFDDNQAAARLAMCTEYSLTPHVFAWLCHDCRQTWARHTFEVGLFKEFRWLDFATDLMKLGVLEQSPALILMQPKELFDKMEETRLEIHKYAKKWLEG